MRIEFEPNDSDFKELYRAAAKRWYERAFFRVAFIAALVAPLVFLLTDRFDLALISGVAVFPIWLVAMRSHKNRAFRLWKEVMKLHGKLDMEIHNEGIRVWSRIGDSNIKWNGYSKYLETSNFFVLLLPGWQYRAVPKRAFAPQELEQFRELLERNVKSSSR